MSLEYLSYDDLVEVARASLKNEIPSIDPTVSNSWARAFVDSCAALSHSNNLQIRDLEDQLFPQTATGDFLDIWLDYEGLERNSSSSGRGLLSVTGTAGTVIPAETTFTSTSGLEYENANSATISNVTLSVTSLTLSGTTATATFSASHNMATGNVVTMAGADDSEYNGDVAITVSDSDSFTYTVSGSPTTPATGTITASLTFASLTVECATTGSDTNVDSGGTLSVNVDDVDSTVYVSYGGLSGGADLEDDDSARERLLLSRSLRDGVFTSSQIRLAALGITGNTRVWVIEPELPSEVDRPLPGEVYIYFMRDDDSDPLPNSTIIAETKQAIIDDGSKPGNTTDNDIYVDAPTGVTVDFTFSSISPDTVTMQSAIEDQLEAFFQDSVDFETDITEASFLGYISNTQDLTTGDTLTSFALSAPTADIAIGYGEIGLLGTVSFS